MENKVELVVFSLSGCLLCEQLKTIIRGLLDEPKNSHLQNGIRVSYSEGGEESEYAPANFVTPRMFPTVIAFVNGRPLSGWEGFAAMEPNEIQVSLVRMVLEDALALVGH
jgi:thioredoxin-like negative regulator of GroEL